MSKILLVDDDSDLIEVLSHILKTAGYAVDVAIDGQAAMDRIAESPPDLLVTDVMIPKLDGWQLCKKIKGDPATSKIPILMVTGKDGNISELMSYESGTDAYIVKPFENEDFLQQIKGLLAGQDGT